MAGFIPRLDNVPVPNGSTACVHTRLHLPGPLQMEAGRDRNAREHERGALDPRGAEISDLFGQTAIFRWCPGRDSNPHDLAVNRF